MQTLQVLARTDWALLKQQKMALLTMDPRELAQAAEGLLNWIDHIQDAVIEDGIAKEEHVFGLDTETN